MKKRLSVLLILLLLLLIIPGCKKNKEIVDYLRNDYNELVAIYNDNSSEVLGDFNELLTGNTIIFDKTTDGYYIINGTITKIEVIYYIVSFNTNCDIKIESKKYEYNDKIEEVKIERPGYKFLGWFYNDALWDFDTNTITSDMNLVSKWEANTYTITINDSITQDPIDEIKIEIKTDETYSLPILSKKGLDFVGYELNGKIIPNTGKFTFNKDINLKAIWDKESFRLSFNTSGGEKIDDIKVYENTVLNELPTPVKKGHKFLGWYDNETLVTLPYTHLKGNKTLTAKWEANEYKITFIENGKHAGLQYRYFGEDFRLPPINREGYEFLGYELDGKKLPEFNTYTYDTDITINVLLKKTHVKITFDSSTGSRVDPIFAEVNSTITKLPEPSKKGHSFLGWYIDDKKVELPLKLTDKDLTLVAKYERNTYTITYMEDGKVKSTQEIKYIALFSLPTLAKEYHKFIGYELDGQILEGETQLYSYDKDITINILWEKTHVKLSFDTLDGTKVESMMVEKNSEITDLPKPIKKGYKFIGWTLDNKLISYPFKIEDKDITLKAKYEVEENKNDYDIYYPKDINDPNFKLTVPKIDDRLILNEDNKTVSFFAPGVSKTKGFYDVNKNFSNDTNLCWAASVSNIIAWYLDRCEELNIDVTGLDRDVNTIFNHFKENWLPTEGYDPLQGFCWYFTGTFTSGGTPDNLINKNSGGYLKHFDHVGDMWSMVDPVKYVNYFGNYQEKFPFIDEEINLHTTSIGFSERIINQLHFGPTAIAVVKEKGSAISSHAITLWGCDYDLKTGLITKIYVTDSDDEMYQSGTWLKEIKMKPTTGDRVMKMVNYYLPTGEPTPFVYIMASTNLFAPNVVCKI